LLGIDMERSMRFREAIKSGCEGIKPGWVRVNFNYFISEAVFDYILETVHLVADDGWKLLPLYRFSVDTGLWRHRDLQVGGEIGLDALSFESVRAEYRSHHLAESEEMLAGYLEEARRIVGETAREGWGDAAPVHLPERLERLRWFPLPNAPLVEMRPDARRGDDLES
jgi:hypothetical protein